MRLRLACAVLLPLCLTACASIIEGTSQEIAVNTNPSGASCDIMRDGVTIGHVEKTPGAATIQKTKNDIEIACTKYGYQRVVYKDHSGLAAASFGNAIFGGLIGVGIDSADGADNKYDSPVNLTMVPAP